MNHTITIGTDLNGRKITATIPETTEITEQKIIAKTNSNNYIAENKMTVEGQTGECSVGYYHYLNGDQAETAMFYVRNSSEVVVNLTNFTLPDDFGVVTEIDDTAVLYDYLFRNCHEKVYVICEDFCKEESMTKDDIKTEIEEQARSYGVPVNSIFNFDGDTIPGGYEEVNDTTVGTINSVIETNSIETNQYVKNGKIVNFVYVATVKNSISANQNIIIGNGLPPEKTELHNGYEFIGMTQEKKIMRCRVRNGVLQIFWLNDSIPAGNQIFLYGTYISQD